MSTQIIPANNMVRITPTKIFVPTVDLSLITIKKDTIGDAKIA